MSFVPCRSMYVQKENYKCYMQESLKTCSAMKVELAFNSKTNYVSGFYTVKDITFVPCRSVYFQEENYKCYKQEGLTSCSALRLELAFNSKTNYLSGFFSVKNISFVKCRPMYIQKNSINVTKKKFEQLVQQ